MFVRKKILHHSHSGRLRSHDYTSYPSLVLLLILTGLALTGYTVSALSPGPESSSVSLNGTMPGPPPKTAATISSPTNNQHFSTSPITIKGNCPEDTLVEIYKNDIFAGSGICSHSGGFSFEIDLLIGKNILIARVYDSLNQRGPDSNPVTVFYDILPPQGAPINSLDLGGAQLLLNTDSVYRGTFPQQQMNVPISVLGGTPPYAVNIEWGDSENKVVPRNDNQVFNVIHSYKKPGTYQITLQATDSKGRAAFLTVAAIVNGEPTSLFASTTPTALSVNKLLVLWPLYTSAIAIVISFWLGERREKHVLNRGGVIYHPQG
jgi:hypothetical protein